MHPPYVPAKEMALPCESGGAMNGHQMRRQT